METAYDKDGIYLGRLADVFGDPTRRSIYRQLREADDPRSATEVAQVFGLHRTVARAHLEKLVELGLVETGTRRRAAGGRPAKTYAITADRLEVMLPPRRYERLARLVLRTLQETVEMPAAIAAAERMGRAYGEEAAAEVAGAGAESPVRMSPEAVIAWMDAAGYAATLSIVDGLVVIEVHNCVYREIAQEFPEVVCQFDKGMLCGMLGVDSSAHAQTRALSAGDDSCRHEFRL